MAGTTKSTEIYMDDMHMESMMCGDLFDHIDDLLEFPNDTDADIMMMGGMMMDPSCTHAALPFPPPPPLGQDHEPHLIPPLQVEADDVLLGAKGDAIMHTGPGNNTGTTTTLNQEDDKVFENLEISDMDWFTNFIYDTADSFSLGFPTTDDDNNSNNNNNNIKEDQSMFRTSSPVSVLESNSISGGSGGGGGSSTSSSSSSSFSSSTGDNVGDRNGGRGAVLPPSSIPESVVPARARSKRPRTTTFSPRTHVTISFLPPSPDSPDISLPAVADPESFGESINPPTVIYTAVKKNTTKKKKKMQLSSDSGGEESVGGPPAARKCTHCQIQKTPQWRAGPLGPKTLCNACGVRYKSGRLFPEYRPAASPTFVPSIHSNSHKKVVEMRLKTTVPAESCDLLDYIRRKE